MLKYFLSISLLLTALCHAETTFYTEPVGETNIVSTNVPIKEGNMLVLSDETIWVIFPVKSSYSLMGRLMDWWYNTQAEEPEDNFLFDPSSWKAGVALQTHLLHWNTNTTEDMKKQASKLPCWPVTPISIATSALLRQGRHGAMKSYS